MLPSMMYPCFACDRHLRESDRVCPFCGAVQTTVTSSSLGPLALAMVLLGSSACSTDPGTDGSTAGTTTSMTTTSMTTTASETETETTASTIGDGDGDPSDTTLTSGSFYALPSDGSNFPPDCDPFAQDCPEGEK